MLFGNHRPACCGKASVSHGPGISGISAAIILNKNNSVFREVAEVDSVGEWELPGRLSPGSVDRIHRPR
jgi:hypothetical protein